MCANGEKCRRCFQMKHENNTYNCTLGSTFGSQHLLVLIDNSVNSTITVFIRLRNVWCCYARIKIKNKTLPDLCNVWVIVNNGSHVCLLCVTTWFKIMTSSVLTIQMFTFDEAKRLQHKVSECHYPCWKKCPFRAATIPKYSLGRYSTLW